MLQPAAKDGIVTKNPTLNFPDFCSQSFARFGRAHIPVLIALRRDLGLGGEIEAIEAQMHAQWDRMEKQFDALLGGLGKALT